MRQTRHLFAPDVLVAPRVRPGKRTRKESRAEHEFAFQCRQNELPTPAREHYFAKAVGRRWRVDFAWLDYFVAVEIEGLVVRKIGGQVITQGRHATVSGFRDDCLKYATAAFLGWTILRFEQTQVRDRVAIEYTMRVLQKRGWKVPQ